MARHHAQPDIKPLYNADERYTEDANKLSQEVALALRPIMEKYHKQGFKVREISQIAASEVSLIELSTLI